MSSAFSSCLPFSTGKARRSSDYAKEKGGHHRDALQGQGRETKCPHPPPSSGIYGMPYEGLSYFIIEKPLCKYSNDRVGCLSTRCDDITCLSTQADEVTFLHPQYGDICSDSSVVPSPDEGPLGADAIIRQLRAFAKPATPATPTGSSHAASANTSLKWYLKESPTVSSFSQAGNDESLSAFGGDGHDGSTSTVSEDGRYGLTSQCIDQKTSSIDDSAIGSDDSCDPDNLLELEEDDSEEEIDEMGLEQVGGVESGSSKEVTSLTNGVGGVTRREKLHPPRTDAHRLSRANLEESGDLELDAILHELCALESQFNLEIAPKQLPTTSSSNSHSNQPLLPEAPELRKMHPQPPPPTQHQQQLQQQPQPVVQRPKSHTRTGSGGTKTKFDALSTDVADVPQNTIARTDSPDNDSAFSDNVSMLSSESSASSGASGGGGVSSRHDPNRQLSSYSQMTFFDKFLESISLTQSMTDQAAKIKAEKIKMALEKLKEAHIKKLFIKAFSQDGSSKSLLVDEKMTVSYVCRLLTDKNHVRVDPKWAIVEHLPDLYMERIYEDDEMLVDNLLLWTRDSKNKLLFLERPDKYDLFLRPEKYFLYGSTQHSSKTSDIDDEGRSSLIEEFFSSNSVPEVEGPLFLKSEGKKAWKKFYFVLRQSGLYYCPKGRSSRSSKDLVCLITLDSNQVYHGFGWKKKFKAPTDWGFAIKLPQLQAKSSKHIKYLCAEDATTLSQWIMGIRIAKHGQRLLENYRSLVEEIAQEDIDILASSRSFSLASVSVGSRGHSEATTPSSESRSLDSCLAPSLTPSMVEDMDDIEDNASSAGSSSQDTPVNTLSRAPSWRHESLRSGSSSSSSGCLSERSSTGTPTGEHGFESDFPQQGTIKRKPSTNPKIPLTSTTRHLVKEVDVDDCVTSSIVELPSSRNSTLRHSARRSLSEEVSSLRRKNSAATITTQARASTTSSASSGVTSNATSIGASPTVQTITPEDEVDSLPLPPPPMDLRRCRVPCDADLLPPPPPELLASTYSLNSLPPPPEEGCLLSFTDDLMMASITSLPPPPPPPPCLPKPSNSSHIPSSPPATPPKPKVTFSPDYRPLSPDYRDYRPLSPPAVAPKPRRESADAIYGIRVGIMSPTEHRPPPVPNTNGWQCHSPPPPPPVPSTPPVYAQPQKSPQKKVKKITFLDDVQNIPPSPSPPYPASPSKPPQLPRRVDSNKLTPPGKLDAPGCKVTPPKSFLNNLQRVMQKKWQVAQKCRDFDKTPHEVLGFRDPVPQRETERNVGAWIQEHYGMLYENLSPSYTASPLDSPTRGEPTYAVNNYAMSSVPIPADGAHQTHLSLTASGRKRQPPPLPKRAQTTQLSARQ